MQVSARSKRILYGPENAQRKQRTGKRGGIDVCEPRGIRGGGGRGCHSQFEL